MAYATGDVIFGVPLVALPPTVVLSEETDEYREEGNRSLGFIRAYSGSHEETPSAFGIELLSLETIAAFTDLDAAKVTVTQELKNRYEELREALPEEVRDDLLALGEPRLFILWSSS